MFGTIPFLKGPVHEMSKTVVAECYLCTGTLEFRLRVLSNYQASSHISCCMLELLCYKQHKAACLWLMD